jgi:hypothetical protein
MRFQDRFIRFSFVSYSNPSFETKRDFGAAVIPFECALCVALRGLLVMGYTVSHRWARWATICRLSGAPRSKLVNHFRYFINPQIDRNSSI